jgi:uncharacterized protein
MEGSHPGVCSWFLWSAWREPVTEESAPGCGFLAEVCKEWEASSQPVEELGVQRTIIRTGVVLSPTESALMRMMLPFKLFAGGPLGLASRDFPGFTLPTRCGSA